MKKKKCQKKQGVEKFINIDLIQLDYYFFYKTKKMINNIT